MGFAKVLESFARQKVDALERRCPQFMWDRMDDPFSVNAIFPAAEWQMESPSKQLEEKQDCIHLFACDQSTQSSLEIYFSRKKEGVAFVWVKLKIDGKLLVLDESCFMDYSDPELSSYSAGGVRLECTAPMRFWRVAFNLMMRNSSKTESERVHVRFGGRLTMYGHTFEIPKELPPSFVARRYDAEVSLDRAKDAICRATHGLQALCQPICLYSEISIGGNKQETVLFGSRFKILGNSNLLQDVRHYIGYAENGSVFHAIKSTDKHFYGYSFQTSYFVKPILNGKFSRTDGGSTMKLSFESGGKYHDVTMRLKDSFNPHEAWNCKEFEGVFSVSKKTHKLFGVSFVLRKDYEIPAQKLVTCNLLKLPLHSTKRDEILSIFEESCKEPRLTGGKGSSLAVLASVSQSLDSFTVPSAVVLTVHAYEVFSSSNAVKNILDDFLSVARTTDLEKIKKSSEECVTALQQVCFPELLEQKLRVKLKDCFGPDWNSKKFAVRSSAVGEDSEEMSAAGQMTTYLGVKSEEQIFKSIVKCWASQFALTAINYKRQYGQELNSAMAVVVQEMVSADCAGVMFTCNPVTSDPSFISITANFGLGESVVSATADPDTYILHKLRGRIELSEKNRGIKNRMIIETEHGDGTEEKDVAFDQSQKFCLTDDQAIKLASIGNAISEVSDSPRDMEWAVVGDKVYLLQSRPVTSFLRETDFEIKHDASGGMYTNREILTRGNLDEVMPGAFSQLGISVLNQIAFEGYQKCEVMEMLPGTTDASQYIYTQSLVIGKKIYLNLSNNIFAAQKFFKRMSRVSMFGYDVSEDEAFKNGIYHELHKSRYIPFRTITSMFKTFVMLEGVADKARAETAKSKIEVPESGTALELFLNLSKQLGKVAYGMKLLMTCTMPSTLYTMLALNILQESQEEKDFSSDLMILLSKLLRSDYEVESAEIPNELSELCCNIRNDAQGMQFPDMSPEEALTWLETDEGTAAKDFRRLRAKHAHRCYKEFDINSKTWDIDPLPLVKTLQANVRAGDQPKTKDKKDNDTFTIEDLPKRPSLKQRIMLNFIIPRAKRAVYNREAAKSIIVNYVHQARLEFRRIAKQLVAEGRLPDADLLFFLTTDEIYRLITTRNPYLLQRAIRRSKMHAQIDKQKFPVLLCGFPKPIETEKVVIDPNAVSMTGTPVSDGIVSGVARVILDFETEAHLIQKGDILVTHATDTGWTPYFPLLSGVVTEIGGLLSHGAVVAREYGLPAVVGINGATQFVKSGERVSLDGTNGIFAKTLEITNDAEPK